MREGKKSSYKCVGFEQKLLATKMLLKIAAIQLIKKFKRGSSITGKTVTSSPGALKIAEVLNSK